jgi:hypothetical protein
MNRLTFTAPARFATLAVLGFALRMLLARRGLNWDMETIFKIGAMPWGADFYAAWPAYTNWGPLGYWAFQVFERLPWGDEIFRFRYYCAAFFSAFDVLTAWVAWRLWGLRAAALFLFAPAAAIIAGYHCNAEPAVIGCAALGLWLRERAKARSPAGADAAWFYALLGVSMAFKHVFILLPVWLAMREVSWRERMRCFAFSYGTWLLIAAPFLLTQPRAFLGNVLLYSAMSGNALVPTLVRAALGFDPSTPVLRPLWLPLFLALMLGLGWWLRRRPVAGIFLCYPVALVALSSAIAPQYFASPALALAVWGGWLGALYHLASGVLMAAHVHELHLFSLGPWFEDHGSGVFYLNRGWHLLQALLLASLLATLRQPRRAPGDP